MSDWIRVALNGDPLTVELSDRNGGARPRDLASSYAALVRFGDGVKARAMIQAPLDEALRGGARDLFRDVFRPDAAWVRSRLDAAPGRRLLVRWAPEPTLAGIPFEALDLGPDGALGASGPLASSASLLPVREVIGAAPTRPELVVGRVRVLVLAATRTGVVTGVEAALKEAVADGRVEPLDVIPPEQLATPADLRRALRERADKRGRWPHILHVVGHGALSRDAEPEPELVLDGDDGAPVVLRVRALAEELRSCFGDHLRLIVLDSCHGAAPSPSGSAAQLLAEQAAVAVVAHLWPLAASTARDLARSFYGSLTTTTGDVAAALRDARDDLAAGAGAAALSPVLYLRGESPVLFDFGARLERLRAEPSGGPPARAALGGRLKQTLDARFSLLLGDPGGDLAAWYEALRGSLTAELVAWYEALRGGVPPGLRERLAALPLADAVQRFALAKGGTEMLSLFKRVFGELLNQNDRPITPLTACLAEVLRPGVHATLLWMPVLEQSLADRHPDRNIYVVQPPLADGAQSLWVMLRAAGQQGWTNAEGWQDAMDPRRDFMIIRANGGYLPRKEMQGTLFTDEDFARIDWNADMPEGWNGLLGNLRNAPALLVGISVFNWRHRTAVRQLFDQRLPPRSLAILPPDADEFEEAVWKERGGGLSHLKSAVDVERLGADELAERLLLSVR